MANTFNVERKEEGKVIILSLDGYLDAHTAPVFEKAIQDEVAAGRLELVADCSKLSYISSAGLGVFMSFIEEIRGGGGDLKLAAIVPKVYQVFEVLGFPALFDIVDDVPKALQNFADGVRPAS